MAGLYVCPEAEQELDALFEIDPDCADLIEVLLQELDNDEAMLAQLYRPHNHFMYEPPFEIKEFIEARNRGKNILILKVRNEEGELLDHRVLFACNPTADTYHVLAVVDREISYDTTDPHFAALLERYQQCGIPTYG